MNGYLEEDLTYLSKFIKDNSLNTGVFLITGGTGYIGSLIVRALQKANAPEIIVVVRDVEKAKKIYGDLKGIRFLTQDLTQKIEYDGNVDYVIHTASPTTSKYFIEKPIETINSIVLGTKNVLDFAFEKKVKSTVYLSSMEAFGQVDDDMPRKEDDLGFIDLKNVRSCYPEGKRLAELMCTSYANEYGLNVCTARLSQVFGAGVFEWDNRVFKQFALSAVRGEDIVLHTEGKSLGNYTYSSDAITAIFTILLKGEKGQTYNVANEVNTLSVKQMAELVAQNFSNGKSKVVVKIPKENMGYAPETKLRLSAEKIRALGWIPKYDLKQMYERMIGK